MKIVVIKEEQFDDINLTDGATFITALISSEKLILNQNINFPLDTKRCIRKIPINNGWNTQIVHILCEECDGKIIFKVNPMRRLPTNVELLHE